MVGAVFFRDILDDLLSALVAEIDIEVRHADALRVQKALEQQIIPQWINARDADAVCGEAAHAGASARADRDTHAFRLTDEIVHDEIVVYITHRIDRRNFIFKAVYDLFFRVFAVVFVQTRVTHAAEIFAVVAAVRRIKARKLRFAELKLHIAAVGDFLCVVRRLGTIREQCTHFVFAFKIEFIGAEFQCILILHRAVRLDADEDVVHFGVFFFNVVAVVRHDERNARIF